MDIWGVDWSAYVHTYSHIYHIILIRDIFPVHHHLWYNPEDVSCKRLFEIAMLAVFHTIQVDKREAS